MGNDLDQNSFSKEQENLKSYFELVIKIVNNFQNFKTSVLFCI